MEATLDTGEGGIAEVVPLAPGAGPYGWLVVDDLVDTGNTATIIRNMLRLPVPGVG